MKSKKFFKNSLFVLCVIFAWVLVISGVLKLLGIGNSDENITETTFINTTNYNDNFYISNTESNENDKFSKNTSDNYVNDNLQSNSNTSSIENINVQNRIPLNENKEKIVDFYNKKLNSICFNTLTLTKTQHSTMEVVEMSTVLKPIIGEKINEMSNTEPIITTKSFINGKSSDGSSLGEMLPRKNGKPSELSPNGVKDAFCTETADGYKIVINLIDETTTELGGIPKYHAQCMDNTFKENSSSLEMPTDDFTVDTPAGNVTVETSGKMTYSNNTITLTLDKNLKIKSLNIISPVNMTLNMKVSPVKMNMSLNINTEQNYMFIY